MNSQQMKAFSDELEKIASHGVELAGLGILAAPSAAELAGIKVKEKHKHIAEIAGLGTLAYPSLKAIKAGITKKASKQVPVGRALQETKPAGPIRSSGTSSMTNDARHAMYNQHTAVSSKPAVPRVLPSNHVPAAKAPMAGLGGQAARAMSIASKGPGKVGLVSGLMKAFRR